MIGDLVKLRYEDIYHSSQLDLIVYDSEHFPVYQRFGDTAVVLPEGVIAVISVKKHLDLKRLNMRFRSFMLWQSYVLLKLERDHF